MNTPTKGNIYFIFILCVQVSIVLLNANTSAFAFLDKLDLSLGLVINQAICFGIPCFIYLLVSRRKFTEVIQFKRLDSINTGLVVLTSFAVQPIVLAISALASLFFNNTAGEIMDEMMGKPTLIILLAIAVTPAFFEEITLRGVVLSNYRNVSIKKAALINGFFFGIMHMNLHQFFYAFALGVLLAYFAYYTGSIIAPMLSHFVINASQVLLFTVSMRAIEENPDQALAVAESLTSAQIINLFVFIAVISAIFLPVSIVLLKTFIQYNRQRILSEAFVDLDKDIEVGLPPQEPKVFTISFWIIVAIFIGIVCLSILSSG